MHTIMAGSERITAIGFQGGLLQLCRVQLAQGTPTVVSREQVAFDGPLPDVALFSWRIHSIGLEGRGEGGSQPHCLLTFYHWGLVFSHAR